MHGLNSTFTRWYDRAPELSQAVRMMEPLPSDWQRMIAHVIIGSISTSNLTQRLEPGIKRIGREKVLGLMKSKGKQRWYDQDPLVHQAFNNLFLMDNALRREIALKVIISIRALEEIEQQEEVSISGHQRQTLLQSIFDNGLEELLEKTNVHLQSQSAPSSIAEPHLVLALETGEAILTLLGTNEAPKAEIEQNTAPESPAAETIAKSETTESETENAPESIAADTPDTTPLPVGPLNVSDGRRLSGTHF
jgi:hypothetical protein